MFINAPMPIINLAAADLTETEYALCLPIVSTKGKNKGSLRASKPTGNGDSAYIWRMVAFQISPIGQHHCLPMMADFDIEIPETVSREERFQWRRNRAKELNAIADKLVNQIPTSKWHGIARWSTAMYG
jgi:hypothetical protein